VSPIVSGEVIGQEIESDKPTELQILGLIDDAHSRASQFLE